MPSKGKHPEIGREKKRKRERETERKGEKQRNSSTMVQKSQELGHKYWATSSFVKLICLHHSLTHSLASSWKSERLDVSKRPAFVSQLVRSDS